MFAFASIRYDSNDTYPIRIYGHDQMKDWSRLQRCQIWKHVQWQVRLRMGVCLWNGASDHDHDAQLIQISALLLVFIPGHLLASFSLWIETAELFSSVQYVVPSTTIKMARCRFQAAYQHSREVRFFIWVTPVHFLALVGSIQGKASQQMIYEGPSHSPEENEIQPGLIYNKFMKKHGG